MNQIKELVDEIYNINQSIALLEQQKKELNKRYDELEASIIQELKSQNMTAYKDIFGHNVSYVTDFRASLNKEMPELGIKWLKENKHEYAIKEVIHPMTLARILKESLESGSLLPDSAFNYSTPDRLIVK